MRWRQAVNLLLLPAVLFGGQEPIARPDTRPQPVDQPAPEYPPALKAQRITGIVQLQGVIDENGRVGQLKVVQATREEFGQAALRAVADWRYHPATKEGQPCAVRVGIPVDFSLSAADLTELENKRSKEVLPPGPPVHPVEELDEWPALKKEIRPDTPAVLQRERRMGQAVMMLIVDEAGVPRDIHPLLVTHVECAEAAATVIKKWRFTPGKKNGKVVRTNMEVTMVFFPENRAASGLRVRPGVRTGNDGVGRLPPDQQAAQAIKEVSVPPKILKQPPPEYPAEMSARGQGGRALVEFIIDGRGRVTHVQTVDQTNGFFAAMAERAVARWEFRPAEVNGAPVVCRVSQLIEFGLSRH